MTPKINTILCPTDLSQNAKIAFSYAMDLAEKYGAELTLLHVTPDIIQEMTASMGFDFAAYLEQDQLDLFPEERDSPRPKKRYNNAFRKPAKR